MDQFTLKKIQATKEAVRQKTAGREAELSEVCCVAGRLVAQTVLERYLAEKARRAANPIAKAFFGLPSGLGCISGKWNRVLALAEAIDRFSEAGAEQTDSVEPTVSDADEAVLHFDDDATPDNVSEIPLDVAAFAPQEVDDEAHDEDDDDEDDTENARFGGIDTAGLEFINVMEQPEAYQRMLEQEAAGEVRLIHRYRRSFLSRLIQARGNAPEYYSLIKNALLSYKGVKDRTSWGYESFNKGRAKVAKINVKSKTVYLYLAIDPALLQDSKYFFDDVSAKKKYADVPVLLKIRGERKLKHALELIDRICAEEMQLPKIDDYAPVDYALPYEATEVLVASGAIKQFTAAAPIAAFEVQENEN